jgi:hypothetical protein
VPELHDFIGGWAFERQIRDRLGPDLTAGGTVTFTRARRGLEQLEEGWIRLPHTILRAGRRYIWHGWPEVQVAFADGRPFHSFDARSNVPEARHRCGDDIYDVRYDFSGWPMWSAAWTVSGPRKSYLSLTRYLPATACAERDAGAEPEATRTEE